MVTRNLLTRMAWLFVVLLTAFALAAPADAAKVLRRGNGAEPKGLDPHQASGDPENQIFGDLFLGLYTEGPDGKPQHTQRKAHVFESLQEGFFVLLQILVVPGGQPLHDAEKPGQ